MTVHWYDKVDSKKNTVHCTSVVNFKKELHVTIIKEFLSR